MYHLGYRCKVVGQTGDAAMASGKPPIWCEDDPDRCVQGAKQMLYWNQLEGDNIEVEGYDLARDPKSPAYKFVVLSSLWPLVIWHSLTFVYSAQSVDSKMVSFVIYTLTNGSLKR